MGRRELVIAAALAAVTLAVYGQVITHQFISLDDDLYILSNPMVRGGLTFQGFVWAFTTFHAANWHPLTWLAHMLDSQLFGLNAGGHLLMNALIHVANTVLVFVFLRRVTGTTWRSAIVAALFALHPLHVESVAWAAERKDTLATFFGLLSLLAYEQYVKTPSPKRYGLVALWLALGLMAKPMLVTWPFLLLLLDYWPLRRLTWRPEDGIGRFAKAWLPLIREKLPLFGLVAASIIATYVAQSHGGAVAGLVNTTLPFRLSNALVSYAKYILLTIWPSGLAVYYPFSLSGLEIWQPLAAFVLIAVVTVVAMLQASARPYLIIGWLWFLGTLVPVIGLVQVGGQAMADRYHYIPSIGLFVAVVFGLADFAMGRRLSHVTIATVSAVILLAFGSLTAIEITRWRNSQSLYERALAVTSDNLVMQFNLGHFLGQQGKFDQAIPHFAEALRIKPDFFDALLNMGMTLVELGKLTEATNYYQQALKVNPDSGKAHMQLALALVKQNKENEALQEFYKAAELAPGDALIRTNLGLMLTRRNRLPEAAAQLKEALRIDPNGAEAHNNLGLVLLMGGEPAESIEHFSAALRLRPNFTQAHDNLVRAQKQLATGQK